MGQRSAQFRIGTSGYQYDHWRDVFYPQGLPKRAWFDRYARHFDTVEVNNTFYHLPKAETFDDWRNRAPGGFCYVLKFSRYGTHMKRLKDPESSITLFLDRADRLGEHLGPILVQLRPDMDKDADRLAAFLDAAPRDHRWAVEFRHPSWLCNDIYDLLRNHNAALCIHDQIDDHPRELTADWVYLRYHGARDGGDYSHQALSAEAQRIKQHLAGGLDVFAFFNNDAHGYAVKNGTELRRYVMEQ